MNLKQYLFALCCAFISGFAFSKDCEKGSENMAQIRRCVWSEFDRRLKIEYGETYKFVSARNLKAAQLLEAAQKSWEIFATDSCKYSLEVRQTEIMGNDARLSCWVGFVDARIKILKSYRTNFGKAD